jgi:hypothetical protein
VKREVAEGLPKAKSSDAPSTLVRDSRLSSLEGISVNDLICIECFAGSAKLSSSLKDTGFAVVAIDHYKNRHRPRCKILSLDLLNPLHVELLWDLIKEPRVAYIHLAPPCGTSSKARELPIRGMDNAPTPLRSEKFLFGLPDLDDTSKARVEAANRLYSLCVQLLMYCASTGILASMENPRSAYTWSICRVLAVESNVCEVWDQLIDVSFQHCMHGGTRNKWSTWKCTSPFMTHLSASCDGNHEHAPWGMVVDNETGNRHFATADEAEYPTLLCQKVANAVLADVISRGAVPQPTQLIDVHPTFDHGFNRIATFQQPRGARYPQLLSEFVSVDYQSNVSPSQPFRLLRIQTGEHGESNPVVGILRTPEQFLDAAIHLTHPADMFLCLPDVLKTSLFKIVSLGPLELSKLRLKNILELKARARDLETQEKQLHDTLPKHLQTVLKNKRLILFRQLLEESLYPDISIVDDMIKGIDVVGSTPCSGVFERKLKPSLIHPKQLQDDSHTVRTALRSTSHRTDDLEQSQAVWKQSLDEAQAGWLIGPFYSEAEVSTIVGSDKWVPTRRFPLKQRNKIRVIDDCKESGINDALKTTEKLNLMDSEALAVLLLHIAATCANGRMEMELQCGSKLETDVHPGWLRNDGNFCWMGRALDLAHAYKQVGCSESTLWASVVQTFDTDKLTNAYFVSASLMFGATASVYSFNRISRAMWFLLARYLHILSINFYDDYPMVEPKQTSLMARSVAETFFKILGWDIAEGNKSLPFEDVFEALGISVDLSNLSNGTFTFALKPTRVEELLDISNTVLETGKLNRAECQSLVGKLLFARGQLSNPAIRAIIDSLLNHAHRNYSHSLSTDVHFAVSMLRQLLSQNVPKTVSWSDPVQPLVVFTDGASEGDHRDPKSHTVGAIFVDPVTSSRFVLDGCVHESLVSLWVEHVGEKFICQVEAYPVLCIVHMFKDLIKHRRILFFLDNDASRHAFVRCTSQSRSMQALAYAFYRYPVQCKPWFARVPTDSNPADLPSRGQTDMAAKLFNCRYRGNLLLDMETLQFLVKHTVQNNKRKACVSNV